MAMADGGELIILAPGVHQFGEDKTVDGLIRKYGYRGRLHTLEVFKRENAADLRANMGAAAHLIHGSSDGRFSITYCVKNITREEVEGVGFKSADYDEMAAKYDPAKLKYGYKGRLHTLEVFKRPDADDLRENMGAAAHLIHGSSDGRFSITYCVKNISKEEVEGVGFKAADYDEMIRKYAPEKLRYGYNTVDGEEIYFIPNPALGLWINREKFQQ